MGSGCAECGDDSATPVTVEYATGRTEELLLCDSCRAEYESGSLVDDISAREE